MSWLISAALMTAYENSRSSPELAAAFSEAPYSDGEQSAPSNSTPTPQAYLSPDRMTAFSRPSRFGMTYAPLTEDRGEELLTWYRAGFHARTSAQQEQERESMATAPAYGPTWRASLGKYDPDTHSLRTAQRSLLGDSTESLQTLPRWGSMRNGELFLRPIAALRTFGKESGLFPTSCSIDAGPGRINRSDSPGAAERPTLAMMAKKNLWPTPMAADASNGQKQIRQKGQIMLSAAVMNWPTPRATDGSKGGPNQRGSKGDQRLVALAKFGDDVLSRAIHEKESIYRNSVLFRAIVADMIVSHLDSWKKTDLAKLPEGV